VTCTSLAACYRPPVGDVDPTGLVYDEDSQGGYKRLIKLIDKVEGVRVLEWNVHYGGLNTGNVIDSNLEELVRSRAKPDVIILTEYKSGLLRQSTKDYLDGHYPYRTWIPYSARIDNVGIMVYSVAAYETSPVENLDWAPVYLEEEDKRIYREAQYARAPDEVKFFDRPYVKLTTTLAGATVSLVPLHLLMPWKMIKDLEGNRAAFDALMWGKNHPLYNQILNLRQKLRRDFGQFFKNGKFIMIGDMNTPRGNIWTSSSYDLMVDGLTSVFPGFRNTFPAFSSDERQKPPFDQTGPTMIDHAFVSPNINLDPVAMGLGAARSGAAMIPLRGSDHYPIYIIVNPR